MVKNDGGIIEWLSNLFNRRNRSVSQPAESESIKIENRDSYINVDNIARREDSDYENYRSINNSSAIVLISMKHK